MLSKLKSILSYLIQNINSTFEGQQSDSESIDSKKSDKNKRKYCLVSKDESNDLDPSLLVSGNEGHTVGANTVFGQEVVETLVEEGKITPICESNLNKEIAKINSEERQECSICLDPYGEKSTFEKKMSC